MVARCGNRATIALPIRAGLIFYIVGINPSSGANGDQAFANAASIVITPPVTNDFSCQYNTDISIAGYPKSRALTSGYSCIHIYEYFPGN